MIFVMPKPKKKPDLTTHGGPGRGQGRKEGSKNKEPAVTPTLKRYALRLSPEADTWIRAEAAKADMKPTPFLEQLLEKLAKPPGPEK